MRARTAVIAIAGGIVAVGGLFAVRAQADDLGAFQPYAIKDQTHYFAVVLGQYMAGTKPPDGPPILLRVIILENLTRDQVEDLIRDKVCKEDGWNWSGLRDDSFYLSKGDGEHERRLTVEVDYYDDPFVRRNGIRRGEKRNFGKTRIREHRVMSKLDLFIMKLKRRSFENDATYYRA